MGRRDSSKGLYQNVPPKKNQAPIDSYRKRLGKKESTGQSKKDTALTKERSNARKHSLGISDIILMGAGGLAVISVIYILLYFSVSSFSVDDN